MTTFPSLSSQTWPRELVAGDLDSFYGNPRGANGASPAWESSNLIQIVPPWKMTGVEKITIHHKCADSLARILSSIWEFYGKDQSKIDAAHLNEFGGSYNYRENVNAPSKLSLHAYGAAIDLAPDENPNGKTWVDGGHMLPRPVIDAFLAEGWCWGGDFNVTKDPMHFQATFNAHSDAPQPNSLPANPFEPVQVPTSIDHLTRMRTFMLEETGWASEISSWQAQMLSQVSQLSTAISAFKLSAQSLPSPSAPSKAIPSAAAPQVFTGIVATVFGGPNDAQPSAYSDVTPGWPDRPGVALPFRFVGVRPKVTVAANGKTVVCDIVDVGPWNTNDPYWTKSGKPQAASGTDMSGRHTNLAGIDLTPAAATAIGIDGKGVVDWSFVAAAAPLAAVSALNHPTIWTSAIGAAATIVWILSKGTIDITPATQDTISAILVALTGGATAVVHAATAPPKGPKP